MTHPPPYPTAQSWGSASRYCVGSITLRYFHVHVRLLWMTDGHKYSIRVYVSRTFVAQCGHGMFRWYVRVCFITPCSVRCAGLWWGCYPGCYCPCTTHNRVLSSGTPHRSALHRCDSCMSHCPRHMMRNSFTFTGSERCG